MSRGSWCDLPKTESVTCGSLWEGLSRGNTLGMQIATRKKLVETSATLLVTSATLLGTSALLVVTRTLLGAKGIATNGARTLLGAPGLTTRNKGSYKGCTLVTLVSLFLFLAIHRADSHRSSEHRADLNRALLLIKAEFQSN